MKVFLHILWENFRNMDKNVHKLMRRTLLSSFALCVISASILLAYDFYSLPILFTIGFYLLKASLMFAVATFGFSLFFNSLVKEEN